MNYLDYIEYNEESPTKLIWKIRPGGSVKKGDVCGSVAIRNNKTYFETNILKNRFYCHRLVWELFNGEIPENMKVDHIKTIPKGGVADNSIENLQLLEHHNNVRKSNLRSNNKSGVTGVRFDRNRNKWVSDIKIKGKVYSKRFKTFEEAVEYRKETANSLGVSI